MSGLLSPTDAAKYVSARLAADFVEDGMLVGLGSGSTAEWMVRCLGRRVREDGLRIRGVPTSTRTAELARREGIAVADFDEVERLDIVIDGADEVDGDMNLIKGGGGALLREKIVASASDRMVAIVDASKRVDRLGAYPLPVEAIPFGLRATRRMLAEKLPDGSGARTSLRMDASKNPESPASPFLDSLVSLGSLARGKRKIRTVGSVGTEGGRPFVTDEGNHVLDLDLGRIDRPGELSDLLNRIPGVVENGLFVAMCGTLVTGREDGRVEVRDRDRGETREHRVDPEGARELLAGAEG